MAYLLIEHEDGTVSVEDEDDYDNSSSLYPKKALPIRVYDEGVASVIKRKLNFSGNIDDGQRGVYKMGMREALHLASKDCIEIDYDN